MGAVHAVEHACGEQPNDAASEHANNAPRGPASAWNNARWRRYIGFGFAGAIDHTAGGAASVRGGSNGR
jgi:hypothetical protein